MKYSCSSCGLAVIIYDGEVFRPCGHETAIIANATAAMHGAASVSA
jgi:uncharacterized Zn finger protein (UPF0148 family)